MFVNEAGYVDKFKCLGSECPNSCCMINWGIQIDDKTNALYQEIDKLKNIIEKRPDGKYYIIQKKSNNSCIKLDKDHLCGVQKDYGADYLSDTCYTYPRNIKRLNEEVFVSANLSCPEIARLVLFEESDFQFHKKEYQRVPQTIQNYGPNDNEAIISFASNAEFYLAFDNAHALMRYLIGGDEEKNYLKGNAHIEKILLFFALGLKISAAVSEPLLEFVEIMKFKLGLGVDSENLAVYEIEGVFNEGKIAELFTYDDSYIDQVIYKYIVHSLLLALYPDGMSQVARQEFLAILLAKTLLLRVLILLKKSTGVCSEESIIEIVNSLSRTYDHIKDPAIYHSFLNDMSWDKQDQLISMLNYFAGLCEVKAIELELA